MTTDAMTTGWAELLRALERVGACCPSKARHPLSYPGVDRLTSEQASCPESLRRAADWLGGHAILERQRRLHHVKVVFEPDQEIEAKAYLGVEHHWCRPVTRRSGAPETDLGRCPRLRDSALTGLDLVYLKSKSPPDRT